jgi:hypothetical protein
MMRLRVGRKVGRTLYLQAGDQPSDDDRLIGLVDTPELAGALVALVAENQRLRDQLTAHHGYFNRVPDNACQQCRIPQPSTQEPGP